MSGSGDDPGREPDGRKGWRLHPSLEDRPDLQPAPAQRGDSVGRGALLVLAGHALALLSIATFSAVYNGRLSNFGEAAFLAAFFTGVYEWLYVVPLLVWAYVKRRRQTAKGIWILAGVSVLPTAACFGVLSQLEL